MKKATAIILFMAMLFAFSISSSAQDHTFELTPDTLSSLGCESLEYMPEQRIYHFTGSDSVEVSLPVSGGIYVYVTAGGYYSRSNGVTDNGVNHVCTINLSFFDENGERVIEERHIGAAVILIPADGAFHRWSLGNDEMYAGLPENIKSATLTVTGENDTAYIKSLYIGTSDMKARDMSLQWETHDVGNIDAQTGTVQRIIMIGFVCAVAAVMMIFAKLRDKYRKGKKS